MGELVGWGRLLVVDETAVRRCFGSLLCLHLSAVVAHLVLDLFTLLLRHPTEFHRCGATSKKRKKKGTRNQSHIASYVRTHILHDINGRERAGRKFFFNNPTPKSMPLTHKHKVYNFLLGWTRGMFASLVRVCVCACKDTGLAGLQQQQQPPPLLLLPPTLGSVCASSV